MVKAVVLVLGVGLTASIVAAGWWAWSPDRSRADLERIYSDPSTQYLDVRGTTLRVRDTGPKHAPTLILLHGFGSSLETWSAWAESLNANYRVVRFDLPGCGLSEPDRSGDYSDARSVALTLGLMDQLGIAQAALIGNSIGGRIAWRFAADNPHRISKLVLISPDGFASPGFDYDKPPHIGAALHLMKYFLPRSLLRMNLASAYADQTRLQEIVVDRYYNLLLAPGNRGALLDRMRQTVLRDPILFLRRIETPTLLLWGRQDHLIPFDNSAAYLTALPHARLVSFENLGHVPHEEAPAQSLPSLQNFLSE